MKKYMGYLLLIFLTFHLSLPCRGQIIDPKGTGYFELGWSADGRRFAYASFFKEHYSDNVPTPEYDFTVLNITVIDLVSDQDLWMNNSQWKDDNPVYP
ncbi:MAG TPA: hypothetical protein VI583_07840, partial [Cyclobacteriaceae bacterium]|nr:hypothetical protein [Cyclobacteriaceae bacterium]